MVVFLEEGWQGGLRRLKDLDVVATVNGTLQVDFYNWELFVQEAANDLLGHIGLKGSAYDNETV